ncbi:unnamed protein product [Prunus armeniaca]|uniref:Uncharacterized protein n=1 Tax=Prunus armeniaca TaxID=36596 RepID=A0A6J5UTB6_PRUAR|nr:unnamed protein product [Prunus armeniaca]
MLAPAAGPTKPQLPRGGYQPARRGGAARPRQQGRAGGVHSADSGVGGGVGVAGWAWSGAYWTPDKVREARGEKGGRRGRAGPTGGTGAEPQREEKQHTRQLGWGGARGWRVAPLEVGESLNDDLLKHKEWEGAGVRQQEEDCAEVRQGHDEIGGEERKRGAGDRSGRWAATSSGGGRGGSVREGEGSGRGGARTARMGRGERPEKGKADHTKKRGKRRGAGGVKDAEGTHIHA